jgi:hypothetical protein
MAGESPAGAEGQEVSAAAPVARMDTEEQWGAAAVRNPDGDSILHLPQRALGMLILFPVKLI